MEQKKPTTDFASRTTEIFPCIPTTLPPHQTKYNKPNRPKRTPKPMQQGLSRSLNTDSSSRAPNLGEIGANLDSGPCCFEDKHDKMGFLFPSSPVPLFQTRSLHLSLCNLTNAFPECDIPPALPPQRGETKNNLRTPDVCSCENNSWFLRNRQGSGCEKGECALIKHHWSL